MYRDILETLKTYLADQITSEIVQVDYYGNMSSIDLRVPAVLIELRTDAGADLDFRWRKHELSIRLWVLAGMTIDYMESLAVIQNVTSLNDPDKKGLLSVLDDLKADATFRALNGNMGGKLWRMQPPFLEVGQASFDILQRMSEKVNVQQQLIKIHYVKER